MRYDISIQIVNYNTKSYLDLCINDAIKDLKDSDISYEIVVLDNNSKDNLSDLEKEYQESYVKFFKSDKNLGFGGGHNLLSKKSESKIILILNPDLRFIQEQTISRLFNILKKNDSAVVVGPKLITQEKKPQIYDHGELRGLIPKLALKAGGSIWKNVDRISQVAWVSGAVFMINRKAFCRANGFDENFFLYREEEDLCWRLRDMKAEIIYDPSIEVLHYGSVVANKDKLEDDSSRYYFKKHKINRIFLMIYNFLHKFIRYGK